MKNKNYTTDDLLRQRLGEAGPMPDADAMWQDFEPILEADFLQNPFDPAAAAMPSAAAAAGKAAASGGFSSLVGWAVALVFGVVLGAFAMLFSEKTADLVEQKGAATTSDSSSEDEQKGSNAAFSSSSEDEKTVAASAFSKKKSLGSAEKSSFEDEQKGSNAAFSSSSEDEKAVAASAFSTPNFVQKIVGQAEPSGPQNGLGVVGDESKSGEIEAQKTIEKSPAPTEKATEKARIQPFSPLFQSKIRLAEPSKKASPASAFAKIRRPALPKIRGRREVMAFVGSDLERPSTHLLGRVGPQHFINFGLGFRAPISNSLWHGRGEIWYSQIDLPTVSMATTTRSDLDGQRFLIEDTTWIHRMAGVSVNAQAERRLWRGFSVMGGLALSYLPLVTARESHFRQTLKSSETVYEGSGFDFSQPILAPAILRRWQFGPRIGLEKTFFDHFFIGAAMTQNLIDYTKNASSGFQTLDKTTTGDGYRVQRNWLGYVGYRF